VGYANLSSDGIVSNDIIYGSSNIVYLDESSTIQVSYSDIEGGWEGEGNIDADPLFVAPDSGDFHLQATSPCIDAGDPSSPLDPDGTIADMGAYYFHQVLGCTDSTAINYNPEATSNDGSCYHDVLTDIDGNEYQAVQIGDQLWMKENLKVTHYNNGDEIPTGYSNSEWGSLSTGAYTVYDDDSSNAEIYGNIYNWFAVDDNRGACPESWHVPTDDEIKQLEMYLGMSQEEADDTGYRGTNVGSKLVGRADLWNDGDLENNPEFGTSGFNLLPGGYRDTNDGYYYSMGDYGYFWSSTENGSNDAWDRALSYNGSGINRFPRYKKNGFSVRCVRDDTEIVTIFNQNLTIPQSFALHQNYPNPFNPITTLRYDLPEDAMVNIIIYDMLSRQVKTLISQTQDAGYRSIIWDATNDYGKLVSAGIYLYQIQAGEYIGTKKMILLK